MHAEISYHVPRVPQRVLMIPPLGKFWTAANFLSLLRVLIAIPITILILTSGSVRLIVVLLLLAAITDWFDGNLARWSKTVSNWGKVLDPLCDKAAVLLVSAALAINGDLPLWFVGLVVLRDVLIVAGSIVLTRRISEVKMSIWWGKLAVSAMALTLLAAILRADEPILQTCIWVTTVLMLISYAIYAVRFVRLLRAEPNLVR